MRSILQLFLVLIATTAIAPEALAQSSEECPEERYTVTMDMENALRWANIDERTAVYKMLIESPPELLTGELKLYARRVTSVDWSGSPAGVAAESHDTILFGDLFFSKQYAAYQQRIVQHELAHIWAFNHLCALEDFASIGWQFISNEGRSGLIRQGGLPFPERDIPPADYATYSPQEDFAVSVELFLEDREGFMQKHPLRGEWLAKNLFTDSGCPTVFVCDVEELFKYEESETEPYGPEYEGPEVDPEDDPGDFGEDPIF